MDANDQIETTDATQEPEPVDIEATVFRYAHTQARGNTYVHLFLKESNTSLGAHGRGLTLLERAGSFGGQLALARGLDKVNVRVILDEKGRVKRLVSFELTHPSLRLDE
jgi:hypothetical protein